MHRARAFFYVAAGVFLLALSYHFGARSAGAQAPGNPLVAVAVTSSNWKAFAANGDTYGLNTVTGEWEPGPNVFGPSTPAQRETFGAMKSRYRGERGAQPTPRGR